MYCSHQLLSLFPLVLLFQLSELQLHTKIDCMITHCDSIHMVKL